MTNRSTKPGMGVALAIVGTFFFGALSGCNRSGEPVASNGVRQTGFPGQYTAGGGTSGQIIARHAATASKAAPGSGAAAGNQEGTRGQAPSGSVAGTPGIPEGAGGTTSGAELGGTTPGAAATKAAPPPGNGSPAVPANESRK